MTGTTDTLLMNKSKFIPNLIVNKYTLSIGGGCNQIVSTNKNMMATSKNAMATSTYVDFYTISILINYAVQEPRSDPGPQVNGLYLLYKFSVDVNGYNPLLSPFNTYALLY